MSSSLHAALKLAHALLDEAGHDDEAYELESAIAMFTPHTGDPMDEAAKRTIKDACCDNCGQRWPAMAMPALLEDVALTGRRLAKCPRCFATEGIKLDMR